MAQKPEITGRDIFEQFETRKTKIGKLVFENSYQSRETVGRLYDAMDYQRGCDRSCV